MLRKSFVVFAVAFSIVFTLVLGGCSCSRTLESDAKTGSTEVAEEPKKEVSDRQLAYQGYYDHFLDLEQKYGVGAIGPNVDGGSALEGACFAWLLDMDNDGIEEFVAASRINADAYDSNDIVAGSDYCLEVWTFDKNERQIKNLYSGAATSTNGACVCFEQWTHNGGKYIGAMGNPYGGTEEEPAWSVVGLDSNGELRVHSFNYATRMDDGLPVESYDFTIDGVSVTESEYDEAQSFYGSYDGWTFYEFARSFPANDFSSPDWVEVEDTFAMKDPTIAKLKKGVKGNFEK